MAFLDKLNQVAKNIGDKTGDAIATSKLNGKIKAEHTAAAEDFKKIGEYYYGLYVAGNEVVPEILEFCQSAQAHFAAAEEAQEEIERIKVDNEAEKASAAVAAPAAPAGITCPTCGTVNGEGTRFCMNCGANIEVQVKQENKCPSCNADVEPGAKFCSSCGHRMEE